MTGCWVKGVAVVSAETSYALSPHAHDQFGIGITLRGAQKSKALPGNVLTSGAISKPRGTISH